MRIKNANFNNDVRNIKNRRQYIDGDIIPKRKRVPTPMETPGFGWRVGISILVGCGWLIFLIVWLSFYATDLSIYQNIAIFITSILVVGAILGSSWVSWGVKYGYKYGRDWDKKKKDADFKCRMKDNMGGGGGAFYFLGFLGALIYFIATAPTTWDAIIGFFKALVWPAFLVYGAMVALGL
jgi:hypothetical protein